MEQKTQAAGDNTLNNEVILALIREIEQGKAPALLSLYDATNRLVFGIVCRILGERSSAEEALLDIYTQIWNQAVAYDPSMSPIEWMANAAHHIAVGRLHWNNRERTKWDSTRGTENASLTVAPEQQEAAREALQALDPVQWELLERTYYRGLSCNEAAAHIGKPVGAVRVHIRSGLTRLGEALLQKQGRDGGAR